MKDYLKEIKDRLGQTGDLEFRFVRGRDLGPFEDEMNHYLSQGCWRVVFTDVSVSDHHYFAGVIRSEEKNQDLAKLVKVVEALDNALTFYRDERNWLKEIPNACSAIIADTGTRAKQAQQKAREIMGGSNGK